MERPVLTFPKPVAEFVRSHYAAANVILEYGSGGSTVLAAEMKGKKIVSVESDGEWKANLEAYLESARPASKPTLIHADIGPTQRWGKPVDRERWKDFPKYCFGAWDHLEKKKLEPDLILVDGRFRVGCFFASAIRTKKPVKLLFDDYGDRPRYEVVEKYFPKQDMVGRMALFTIDTMTVPSRDIVKIAQYFYSPG